MTNYTKYTWINYNENNYNNNNIDILQIIFSSYDSAEAVIEINCIMYTSANINHLFDD